MTFYQSAKFPFQADVRREGEVKNCEWVQLETLIIGIVVVVVPVGRRSFIDVDARTFTSTICFAIIRDRAFKYSIQ